MGIKNYLIEGVSCTGKTTVCRELERRGYHTVHGDDELAYQGDPRTGVPSDEFAHGHHIWHVEKVRAWTSDRSHAATFFCGGSRNWDQFIHVFDAVFVLEVDLDTLNRRLAARPDDEWGGPAAECAAHARIQHEKKEDIPSHGIVLDSTAPVTRVVDAILRYTAEM